MGTSDEWNWGWSDLNPQVSGPHIVFDLLVAPFIKGAKASNTIVKAVDPGKAEANSNYDKAISTSSNESWEDEHLTMGFAPEATQKVAQAIPDVVQVIPNTMITGAAALPASKYLAGAMAAEEGLVEAESGLARRVERSEVKATSRIEQATETTAAKRAKSDALRGIAEDEYLAGKIDTREVLRFRAEMAERNGLRSAVQNGHDVIQGVGNLYEKGPDYITYSSKDRHIYAWDATIGSKSMVPPETLVRWLPEIQNAVKSLADPILRKRASEALESGRVWGQVFKQ